MLNLSAKEGEHRTIEAAAVAALRHNAVLRQGDWKLVGKDILSRDGVQPGGHWELYDLANDPAEQHDLSCAEPGKVKDLSKKFLGEARRTLVPPAP
jgi:arylsulfatase A-like enzyme